jgi:hypothetical protein
MRRAIHPLDINYQTVSRRVVHAQPLAQAAL